MKKFLSTLKKGNIIELSGWDWNTNSQFIDEDFAADFENGFGPIIFMVGYYINHNSTNIRCAGVRVEFDSQSPDVKYIHDIRLAAIDHMRVLNTRQKWSRGY